MKYTMNQAAWRTPAIWAGLALLPLVMGEFGQAQLAQFMIYGIFALSLGFLWGHAGVLSFGHAIFFGIGAYAMALVSLDMVPALGNSALTGLLLAIGVSGAAAAVFGAILFYGKGLAGAFFGIVTLCAAVIIESVAGRWEYIGGNNGLFGVPGVELPESIPESLSTYYMAFLIALLVYIGLRWLSRTPYGTILAGIRDNDKRMAFLGYNIALHKNIAFVLSSMLAALAGALFAKMFGFVSPTLAGFALSTEVLIWVAVGGRHVLMGAFLGALLVRGMETILSERFGNYWLLLLGMAFVVVVVFFPTGLFGRLLHLGLPTRFARSRALARQDGAPPEHVPQARADASVS